MKASQLLLSFLIIIFIFQSCATSDYISEDSKQLESSTSTKLVTKSSSSIFYHEDTGFLIQEQGDPFIAREGSIVTHKAIEFHPKNLKEYKELISYSDSVFVSFFPFGFSPVREVSDDERCNYLPFPSEEKYYISHSQFCEDSPQNNNRMSGSLPDDSMLPYLYVVWPVDLTIPQDIEHFVRYDVSMPSKKGNDHKVSRFEGTGQISLPIKIDTYDDDYLFTYVPMEGIKVRVSYGSFYCDYYMNSNGSATIQPLMFNDELTLAEIAQLQVYVIYQTPKFTVSRNTAIIPIQKYLGTVSSLWGPMSYNTTYPTYVSHQSSGTNECDVFQGARYYHYGNHSFSSLISSSEHGIIIHASTEHHIEPSKTFIYPNNEYDPTIYVYDEFVSISECIASVNHELGHVHHYYAHPSFFQVDSLIVESFASYVGWYVGEQYYLSKGFVKPNPGYIINRQSRQSWEPYSTDKYTPLFVDLTDNYNQANLNDTISDVPVSVINGMITTCSTVNGCMSYLLTYSGTYYTSSELISHFGYYL